MTKIKVEAIVKQRLFYRFSIVKIRIISFFDKQLASNMTEELIKDIESNLKKIPSVQGKNAKGVIYENSRLLDKTGKSLARATNKR